MIISSPFYLRFIFSAVLMMWVAKAAFSEPLRSPILPDGASHYSLVGLSYLMQFNFTVDFPNSKLYLRPRKSKLNLLHLKDMSGLGVLREESDLVVRRIDPQSPAAKADVRVGDIVVSVNGVPAETLRLFPLRNSFCEAGKRVQLGMRRGTREWTVDLELRDWRNSASEKDCE